MKNDKSSKTAFGIVSILGAPNVGKSTLINALVGTKVSIVSPKIQTTRSIIRGIMMSEDNKIQIVINDTPGVFTPKKRLDKAMVGAAFDSAKEGDQLLLMIDAKKGIDEETEKLIVHLKETKRKAVCILNKTDLIKDKTKLLPLTEKLHAEGIFSEIFMVSALKADGVKELKALLFSRAKKGPHFYPDDEVSTLPARMFAAEITREKLFINLYQELPYGLSVETEAYTENPNGSVKIEQSITVASLAHKKIVIGDKAQMLKKIGEQSRKELTRLLGVKVHLYLFVKVKEDWQDRKDYYTPWGLDFNAK